MLQLHDCARNDAAAAVVAAPAGLLDGNLRALGARRGRGSGGRRHCDSGWCTMAYSDGVRSFEGVVSRQ